MKNIIEYGIFIIPLVVIILIFGNFFALAYVDWDESSSFANCRPTCDESFTISEEGTIKGFRQSFTVPNDVNTITKLLVGVKHDNYIDKEGGVTSSLVISGITEDPDLPRSEWLYSHKHWLMWYHTDSDNDYCLNPIINPSYDSDTFCRNIPLHVNPGEKYYLMLFVDGPQTIDFHFSSINCENCYSNGNVWPYYDISNPMMGPISSENTGDIMFTVESDLNNPPVCNGVSGPNSGETNTRLTFTASGSDPDSDSLTYRFNWGDSSPYSSWGSKTQSHIFTSEGTYNVKAQVKDSNGALSAWSNAKSITIFSGSSSNNNPTCTGISGPTSGNIGDSLTFTVSGNDPDGDSLKYMIDYGDGTTSNWQSSNQFQHTYSTAKTFYLSGRVKDSNDAMSQWSSEYTVNIEENTNPNVETVEFNVYDFNNNPISGATINIDSESKTSYTDGIVTYSLSPDIYSIVVTSQSYKTFQGTFTVVSDDANVFTIRMASLNGIDDSEIIKGIPTTDNGILFGASAMLLSSIVIGLIVTGALLVFKFPLVAKYGITIVLWIIIFILYLLGI